MNIENYQAYGAFKPTGATIGLDLLATATRTAGVVSANVVHLANTVACHIEFPTNPSASADNTHTMFMPGERLIVLPEAHYVSVIKVAGQPDGILRMTIIE